MKKLFSALTFALCSTAVSFAQPAAAAAAPAAPAAAAPRHEVTDVLERFVNWLHHFVPGVDDTLFHWLACAIIIALAIFLRHVVTDIIFFYLKKVASKTTTTLDDKLFPALEGPVATFVMLMGIFGALTALQLSALTDRVIDGAAKVAILATIIWGLIRAGGAVLDHFGEIAHQKKLTVATFMPLIKKTLMVFAVICGVLFIADTLGAKVGTFLATLGIGGLAFALAAQDTIANLFGSFVVVMDQPFRVGEFVKIGGFLGGVEDIGLRSTKLRALDKSLVVIPNKTVAGEIVTNLARFTQRRAEQVIGLTYNTPRAQMDAIVEEFRQIILRNDYVDPTSVLVYFRDFSASSLDIWVVYVTKDGDFKHHMETRQQFNLEFMRAVEARGLSFAFPTQTIDLPDAVIQKLKAPADSTPPNE